STLCSSKVSPASYPLSLHDALPISMLSLRARGHLRLGDLAAAEADAQAAIELAHDLLSDEYLVMAVSSTVLAGLERDKSPDSLRSEEHTSELQSLAYIVCRLLLEKK